ncbi:MAG: hypothetical protein MUF45_18435 [Spirosomaceae bacterium]|nr:hypothetical protein [Spirosomataceae bacterium]
MTHNYLNLNDLFISLENPEVKSQPTGVSTFAISTSQRTDQKLQKSFHLTDPKKNFKIFFPTLQKKIKKALHSRHSMTQKLNIDNGLKGLTTRTTGYNSGNCCTTH